MTSLLEEVGGALPPLLADIIRHGVRSRVQAVTITTLADGQQASVHLRQVGPDVVILGPAAEYLDATAIRTILPHARVLTVSADLSHLVDLDTGERAAFTPDALAARLRQ